MSSLPDRSVPGNLLLSCHLKLKNGRSCFRFLLVPRKIGHSFASYDVAYLIFFIAPLDGARLISFPFVIAQSVHTFILLTHGTCRLQIKHLRTDTGAQSYSTGKKHKALESQKRSCWWERLLSLHAPCL